MPTYPSNISGASAGFEHLSNILLHAGDLPVRASSVVSVQDSLARQTPVASIESASSAPVREVPKESVSEFANISFSGSHKPHALEPANTVLQSVSAHERAAPASGYAAGDHAYQKHYAVDTQPSERNMEHEIIQLYFAVCAVVRLAGFDPGTLLEYYQQREWK